QAEGMNAEVRGAFDNAPRRLRARAMALRAVQCARGGPAPVSVADNGDVQPRSYSRGCLWFTFQNKLLRRHAIPCLLRHWPLQCTLPYKARTQKNLPLARRPDQRLHVIQVFLQRT